MRDRLKGLVDVPAAELPFAVEVADRLGVEPKIIAGMDIGDVLALTGFFQAMKGKPAQFNEIIERLDGRVQANFTEETPKPVDPEKTQEAYRLEAISLYKSIIDDPQSTPRDKLSAQNGINAVMGLVNEGESVETASESAEKVRTALAFMLGQTERTPDDAEPMDTDEVSQDSTGVPEE